MTPEEIRKKIAELLHSRLNLINGELLSSEELQKEVEGATKEITDKVFKEISALPTIKGWVARDEDGALSFFGSKPYCNFGNWVGEACIKLNRKLFPAIKMKNGPMKVELPIIRK